MKDLIIKEFFLTCAEVEETEEPKMRIGNGFLVMVLLNTDRVNPFIIVCNEAVITKLTIEYDCYKDNYGESPFFRLFDEILKTEAERWIVDTDVLSWNIQVGTARDFDDLNQNIKMFPIDEFDQNFGINNFGKEMVFYLSVQLNDYMS